VWVKENSPYVVDGTTVVPGVTLTINPGVVVKFSNGGFFKINGKLMASGTSAEPIIFTSFADDEAAGDTNGDGDATAPAPGDWWSIFIGFGNYGAAAEINNAVIKYGGQRLNAYDGALYLVRGAASVGNVKILHSQNVGILQNEGELAVFDSEISDQETGIYNFEGSADVRRTKIGNSASRGINIAGNGSLTIVENEFFNNTSGSVSVLGKTTLVNSANRASGGGIKGILINGAISENKLWEKGLPYIVGDLKILNGSTLAIAPGATVKFMRPDSYLRIDGGLTAAGTQAEPVVFTSIKDDASGGDDNGDGAGTIPSSGDWGGIFLEGNYPDAALVFDFVIAKYGGGEFPSCPSCRKANVSISGGRAVIGNSRLSDAADCGIVQTGGETKVFRSEIINNLNGFFLQNGSAAIEQSSFLGNAASGVTGNAPTPVAAENNWWGSAGGPFNEITNPDAAADRIIGSVAFLPFLSVRPADPFAPPVVNIPPVAAASAINLLSGEKTAITLVATDADDDVLAYFIQSLPQNGDLFSNGVLLSGCEAASCRLASETVEYVSNNNFDGDDAFLFYADDGKERSLPVTVKINVIAPLKTRVGIKAVAFASAGFGFLTGNRGIVSRYDENIGWERAAIISREDLNAVSLLSKDFGFAVGDKGKIVKWDGLSWSSVASPATKKLNAVSLLSKDFGFAVGDHGVVLRWDGTVWTKTILPEKNNLKGVFVYSPAFALAVGERGTILRYDGQQWKTVKAPTKSGLAAVYVVAADVAFAVGERGTILRYDGQKWKEMCVATKHNLNGIFAFSADYALAVGDDGTLLRYRDGKWREIKIDAKENLNGVWVFDEQTAVVVGEKGVVISEDGGRWTRR
jgi:hypothetical protein